MRECQNNRIEGNIIEENNRNGIYIESSNAINITRCDIVKNKQRNIFNGMSRNNSKLQQHIW
jgi:parallel beta-helix repeat protein